VRFRDRLTNLTHGLKMRNQSIVKIPARFFFAVANGDSSSPRSAWAAPLSSFAYSC